MKQTESDWSQWPWWGKMIWIIIMIAFSPVILFLLAAIVCFIGFVWQGFIDMWKEVFALFK